MAEVTIHDVYTTGADGARKWVFNPGDASQFNIDHTFSDDLPLAHYFVRLGSRNVTSE